MNNYYTYMLIDPRNNLPFYIGKGQRRRCYSHITEARTTNKNSPKLNKIRKIESLGLDVIISIVDCGVSDAQAKEFEIFLIEECRLAGINLTNQTAGGDGSSGYKHTEDAIKKIGDSQRGKPKPESQKEKLSIYLIDNPIHSREGVKEKVSGENHWTNDKAHPNKGKPLTEVHREKISKSLSGENHPQYGIPCSDDRRMAIKKGTLGVKKTTTINMKKPKRKVECPHCLKMISGGNATRWHGDNCKEKSR